jgi:hypothetical protein
MLGCQMVCFQTKNPNLGKFWRGLQWKILVYFMTVWFILRPLEIFYGHLVYFCPFWYFVPRKIWQPWSDGTVNAGGSYKICSRTRKARPKLTLYANKLSLVGL